MIDKIQDKYVNPEIDVAFQDDNFVETLVTKWKESELLGLAFLISFVFKKLTGYSMEEHVESALMENGDYSLVTSQTKPANPKTIIASALFSGLVSGLVKGQMTKEKGGFAKGLLQGMAVGAVLDIVLRHAKVIELREDLGLI